MTLTHDAQAASYLPVGAGGAGALIEELRHAKYTLAQLQSRLGAQEREVRHRDSIIRMQAERLHKAQTLCNVSESVSLAKQREVDALKQQQLLAALALRSAVRDRDSSAHALRDMTALSELALQQEQEHLERNKELTLRAAQLIKRGEKEKAERLLATVRDSVASHQGNIVYPLQLDSQRLSSLLAHTHIDQTDRMLDGGSPVPGAYSPPGSPQLRSPAAAHTHASATSSGSTSAPSTPSRRAPLAARPQTPLPPVPAHAPPLPPVPAHLTSHSAASSLYPASVNAMFAATQNMTMPPFYDHNPSLRTAELALVRARAMHGVPDAA